MKPLFTFFLILAGGVALSQQALNGDYWNRNTVLLPWRPAPEVSRVSYVDLDKDGDPDLIRAFVNQTIPIMWIDDDDDMKAGDLEGDTDSDCLLIDKNKDGVFAGPMDFSIDWNDEDKDGKADMQLIVNNAGLKVRNFYDWGADFMYILDDDKDGIMHYVDWNKIMMQAWEHNGHANFFTDYHGNSTFLKMHASSFRIDDLRFNWENPFIFYDTDHDKLTEMAIRLVDTPIFRDEDASKNGFDKLDSSIDVKFSKKIDYAAITWDLDDDNAAGNEFDFDMSMLFRGKGFSYEDQGHKFNSLKGLPAANRFFYDKRWRNLDQLFYPDRDTAYNMIFKQGDWQECRIVFDEDDDCNRWERVEFYDPKDVFKIGTEQGGLDHNKQADAAGDRGEFDQDNSGKGQLYIGAFDGRIHLYGAEWGAWRIDQTAFSYQGFGGQYDRWRPNRLQTQPEKFGTVKYTDTDGNGFIDLLEYDLDGDKAFEEKISLKELGLEDKRPLISTASNSYSDFKQLFSNVAENMWSRAMQAVEVAKKHQINTSWYAFYMQPRSLQEKYDYGFWLNFYIYRDLKFFARSKQDQDLLKGLDKAYYSGNWYVLNEISASQVREQFKKNNSSNKHPRLFFSDSDIERIKKLYSKKDKLITIGYNKLKKEADEILTEPLMHYQLDDAKLRIPSIHRFASQLPPLVMMYKLTGNKAYAQRAWEQLELFTQYPDWGANRHFLDTGIAAFDFALAYDALFDYLNEDQKARLRSAVLKQALLPAKKQMENNAWWNVAHHNWNGICNGGLIMASLAMFEEDPKTLSEIIALAANGLPHYINAFEPDGQSEEGVMYWGYGLMYTTIAFESMDRVLGTTFKLDQTPGFKKTGWFPVYVSGPVTSLSIGDDPLKKGRTGTFFWFAKRFNDPALAKLQYDLSLENKNVTWADMIYYRPEMIKSQVKVTEKPRDNYIRGIEIMSLRENWRPDALYISMHGGSNSANHGHLDAGTFDIQGMGEVWAYGNLGSDNYTYPGYFSKETKPGYFDEPGPQKEANRWHFYRLRAEGKNALVFNPGTYPDQDEHASAEMLRSGSAPDKGFFILDLTSCYKRDVSSYQRGIRMNREQKVISVRDEFSTLKPSLLWWGMHTKADITITDPRTAELKIGNKKMIAHIASPSNAAFQVLPASYLPGESFPLTRNSNNTGFKKLAFRLDNVTSGPVQVDFYPADASPKQGELITRPLKDWAVEK